MKILTVFYTMYGHTFEMANAVNKGVASVESVEATLRRVEEFDQVKKIIEDNDFTKQVSAKLSDIPICSLDDLREADGVIFGSPTRFGNMAAQMKQLFDAMGSLWVNGEMEGKPAGLFTSTATTHGGQETTLLTMMPPLIHLGMLVVGVPYSVDGMIHTEAKGGTPYGASTIAGPEGQLVPDDYDLSIASALGKRVATIATLLRAEGTCTVDFQQDA